MTGTRSLAVVSTAASLLMIGVGMIVAMLPHRVLMLSGSLQDVGYLASFFALSYLLVQLPVGRLADRFGAKPFLILGYLLCSVSGMVFFLAPTPEAIFFGRIVQGIGEAPVWAIGPALLSLAYPHAKGRMIGVNNAAIHAGLMVGPLAGIVFFSDPVSHGPFLLFSALCFLGAVIVMMLLPKSSATASSLISRTPAWRDMFRLLRFKAPLLTLCGILLYGAGYGIFVSVLPASLSLTKQFDSYSNGIFFSLFYAAISISQLIVGPLSDRQGRRAYMIAGLAMAAIGIATFNHCSLPVIYLPLTFASLGLGIFCVSSMAFLNECVPDTLKATISGSYYLSWGLGYFLGPLLVGWSGNLQYAQSGYYILAMLFAALALVLKLSRADDFRIAEGTD